jgi:WD40 repeat protein
MNNLLYKIKTSAQNVNNEVFVSFIVCNPKGEQPNIIIGFNNGKIKLFNFRSNGTLKLTKILTEHTNSINYISFNPINPNIFSSCSSDNSLILWNFMNNDDIQFEKITFHSESYSSIFSYDGSLLCCFYNNELMQQGTIILYNINIIDNRHISISFASTYTENNIEFYSICFHPNNKLLFIGTSTSVIILNIDDNYTITEQLKFRCNYVLSTSCNILGDLCIFTDLDNYMNIIDIRNEKIKLYKIELQKYFSSQSETKILFHPRNPYLFAIYDDNNIIILDISSPKIKCICKYHHPNKITCISFNFSGNVIIFSSENKLVILEIDFNVVNRRPNTMKMLGNIAISAH